MSRKPNSKCEICGKERYRRPSELKRNKHNCCRGCRSKLYKKSKNYSKKGLAIGRGWNKGKSKKNGDILTYGKPRSEKTKKNISIALKKAKPPQGINKKCSICGKKFYVFQGQLKGKRKRIFCSKNCHNKKRLTGKIVKCPICKKEFYKAKKSKKICCSVSCSMKFLIPTDIERILEDWLKKSNISYESQKPIGKITIPDFFIKPNICLYADGDYWHNLPRSIIKDKWVNKILINKGYKIIRLWGSEIKNGVRPIELLSK